MSAQHATSRRLLRQWSRWLLPASISSSALIHGVMLASAFLFFQAATIQQLPADPVEPATLTTLILPEPVFTTPEEPEESPDAGGAGPAAPAPEEIAEPTPPPVEKKKKPVVKKKRWKKKVVKREEEPKPPEPEQPEKPPEVTPIAAVTDDPAEAEAQQPDNDAPTLPEATEVASATAGADDGPGDESPAARAGYPGGTGPGSGNAAAGAGQGDGPDLGALLRGYKRKVARELRRSRRYPRSARRRGLQGTVVLELVVNSSGGVVDVRVAQSSGHDVLDDAAVKAVRSVGRLPAPPHELGWTRRSIRIPFNYKLT